MTLPLRQRMRFGGLGVGLPSRGEFVVSYPSRGIVRGCAGAVAGPVLVVGNGGSGYLLEALDVCVSPSLW